jgi:effector-binding domain-containing protein
MGKDFERGLKQLKELVETAAANAKPDFGLQVTEVTSGSIYGITEDVSWSELNDAFFGSRYGEINTYLAADGANLSAPPLAIFHKWDEENKMTNVEVALACESKKPGSKRVVKRDFYSGKVVKGSFYGPYSGTGAVHYAIEDYMNSNALEMAGSPWESYVTDPATEPDTLKWLTEIYYPVKAVETAKQ